MARLKCAWRSPPSCGDEAHLDRPDVFRQERAFLPNDVSLVPGGTTGANGR